MDAIEVIDTALKIGLGAVIAGVGTYAVARVNISGELRKRLWERRCDALEDAAEKAEETFDKFRCIYSLAGGRIRRHSAGVNFKVICTDELVHRDKEYMRVSGRIYLVLARLRLHGAGAAADALLAAYEAIHAMRDPLMLDGIVPTWDEFRTTKTVVEDRIAEFHKQLGKVYSSMQPH